jgi:exonuclease VII large subunit
MITDDQIKKISFAIAVVGIAGIAIVSQFAGAEKVSLRDLDEGKLGKVVEVMGTIAAFSEKDGHVFLDITDGQNKLPVVMFERTARSQKNVYSMAKGDNVTVTGKVLLYKNELEIQAETIKKDIISI